MSASEEMRLRAIAADVQAHADELNRLDGVAGDGDLGVTVGIAARALDEGLSQANLEGLASVLAFVGGVLAKKAPSTGGTLVATGFLRCARSLEADPDLPYSALLSIAATGIMDRGGAAPGDRTMLDALIPAAEAARLSEEAGGSFSVVAAAAAEAARVGALATSSLRARHGRAGWLADRADGHPDAGATLVALLLTAVTEHSS